MEAPHETHPPVTRHPPPPSRPSDPSDPLPRDLAEGFQNSRTTKKFENVRRNAKMRTSQSAKTGAFCKIFGRKNLWARLRAKKVAKQATVLVVIQETLRESSGVPFWIYFQVH